MRLFRNKEMRKFDKLTKKHRKALKKLIRNDWDFEWGCLHNLVMTKIHNMYEYYTSGNNVWQSNETLLPLIESLKHVITLDDKINSLWDNVSLKDATTYKDLTEQEQTLYAELYKYIGENILAWWD